MILSCLLNLCYLYLLRHYWNSSEFGVMFVGVWAGVWFIPSAFLSFENKKFLLVLSEFGFGFGCLLITSMQRSHNHWKNRDIIGGIYAPIFDTVFPKEETKRKERSFFFWHRVSFLSFLGWIKGKERKKNETWSYFFTIWFPPNLDGS